MFFSEPVGWIDEKGKKDRYPTCNANDLVTHQPDVQMLCGIVDHKYDDEPEASL